MGLTRRPPPSNRRFDDADALVPIVKEEEEDISTMKKTKAKETEPTRCFRSARRSTEGASRTSVAVDSVGRLYTTTSAPIAGRYSMLHACISHEISLAP